MTGGRRWTHKAGMRTLRRCSSASCPSRGGRSLQKAPPKPISHTALLQLCYSQDKSRRPQDGKRAPFHTCSTVHTPSGGSVATPYLVIPSPHYMWLRYAPPPLFALRYGVDLTANAARLDPVIGRDEEIRRVVQVLCRRCVGVGARGVDQVWKMMGWGAARAAGAGDQHGQDSSKL